jgi:hypothetical protein
MLIDCHTHTSRYSSCSVLSPGELCLLARERGMDGLVLTEHRVQWPDGELRALREHMAPLAVYSGMEVSTQEGYDVVCITPHRLRAGSFPSMRELLRLVEPVREECFLFVAHPFRYSDSMGPELRAVLQGVDGIEMNSANIMRRRVERENGRFRPANHRRYAEARDAYGLVGVYNTDTHHPSTVGAIANRLRSADGTVPPLPADEAELSALLRRARVEEHQNTPLLDAYLHRPGG